MNDNQTLNDKPISENTPQEQVVVPENAPSSPAPSPSEPIQPSPPMDEPSEDTANDFEKMMEAYEQKIADIHKGAFTEGKIVKIKEDTVLVDVGTRCEGIFPTEEIRDRDGNLKYSEGDTITVQILSSTASDYSVRLSHKNALHYEHLGELKQKYHDGTPVEGKIVEAVKGGLKVDINGMDAFLPASQVETRYVENMDKYIGLTNQFRIIKFNLRQKKLLVSRRILLEEEQAKKKEETWANLNVGDVVKGNVSRLTGYGVFVDLGGIDGLIHISNLSWDKVKKPSELVRVGQEITAQVIELDHERERIGLGLKQMVEDPWLTVNERYHVDQKVTGTVEKLENFGAFIKLEPGITALIPISEMSWTRRIKHPSDVISRGDQVDAVILRVDQDDRKISLSLKQVTPSPFAQFVIDHPIGTIVEGEVTNVVGYGAFVKLEDGVEGLLHISELSWLPVRNIDEAIKPEEKVKVRIISVNEENNRISLSIKSGEPSDEEAAQMAGRSDRPPRERSRKPPRREKSEDQQYILKKVPTSSTKLGELFPKDLLEKMKSNKDK